MLISHRKKFIYLKTGKTASTSVEVYFEKYCKHEGEWSFSHARDEYVSDAGIIGYRGTPVEGKQPEWFNHMNARMVRDKVDSSTWNDYFKFCVIRNPYDKIVSLFFYLNQGKEWKSQEDTIKGFRWFVQNAQLVQDKDIFTIDGKLIVDHTIRFETLPDSIKEVCTKLDLPYEPDALPKLKVSQTRLGIPLADYYDDATVQAVKNAYAFELETFGYELV